MLDKLDLMQALLPMPGTYRGWSVLHLPEPPCAPLGATPLEMLQGGCKGAQPLGLCFFGATGCWWEANEISLQPQAGCGFAWLLCSEAPSTFLLLQKPCPCPAKTHHPHGCSSYSLQEPSCCHPSGFLNASPESTATHQPNSVLGIQHLLTALFPPSPRECGQDQPLLLTASP